MFEEDTTPPPPPATGASKVPVTVLALVVAALAIGGFFWTQRSDRQLTAQIAALDQLTRTQSDDIRVLRERLHMSAAELQRLSSNSDQVQSSVSATQQQLASTRQQMSEQQQATVNEIAAVRQDTGNQLGAINGQISGVKTNVSTNHEQIVATQKDLADAKAQLTSAIGDLGVQSGLIATTRDQLGVLERAGQRRYFEFTLNKSKQPQRVGPIGLQLKKIDTKHERYTMDVFSDDARIEKKDKTLNEPVQFLVGSQHQLYELVVYHLDKHTVTGYLSAPKYPNPQAPGKS